MSEFDLPIAIDSQQRISEVGFESVAPGPDSRRCAVHINRIGDIVVASVAGIVDCVSVGTFGAALTDACSQNTTRVVVDLADVDFISATGLGIIDAAAGAVSAGGGVLAVNGPRAVTRPLRHTGLSSSFPVFDWLTDAFEAVGRHPVGN